MLAFVRKKCPGVFVLGDKTDSDNVLGYYMWSIADNRLIMDAVTAECHGFSEPVASRGVTIEQVLEKIDVEMRDRVAQAIFDSITTGAFFDQRYKVNLPDGSVRWIVAKGRAIFDADNTPFLGIGSVRDITLKKPYQFEPRQ
ncbi:PAS domain-containing protein [Agrobacterium burrii]|uniref:PAS domain-containing protein n=1 Tax=Agrobacterium burrii TaxID=2815339 RepID=A0ABS3ECQ9_9HYPH|nr:PAS domain-containing protein [Agrobacterium burrii]